MSWAGAILVAAAAAGQVEVRVSVEPPESPYHRQVAYTAVVEAPEDAGLQLKDMTGRFGGLEVYGTPEREVESIGDGRQRVTMRYELDPIFIGVYAPEPFEVEYGEGETAAAPSPSIRIRDLTPLERTEAERFAGADGPYNIPLPWYRDWRVWLAVALLGAAIAAVAARFIKWGKERGVFSPQRPSWEIAYEQLRALDKQQLPQRGAVVPYYVELSAILRRYIEARFHIHAPEQTTQEFLEAASGRGVFSPEQEESLARFLRHCDRVKFAQFTPTAHQMEESFAEALRFVDETVPKQETAEEKAA